MDILKVALNDLLINDECKSTQELYSLFSAVTLNKQIYQTFTDDIIPQLYSFFDLNVIQKELMFLALIANPDKAILTHMFEYEKSKTHLSLTVPTSVFNVCFYLRKHWFSEIIDKEIADEKEFSCEILNNVKILKLVNLSNGEDVNLNKISRAALSIDNNIENGFLNIYVLQVKEVLRVIKFIKNIKADCDEEGIYKCFIKHSLLKTLSRYIDFKCTQYWKRIEILLSEYVQNKEAIYKQNMVKINCYNELDQFNAYTIIHNCLKCLKLCKNYRRSRKHIKHIYKVTEAKVLSLKKEILILEVLENVFAFNFVTNSEISRGDNTFFCNEHAFERNNVFLLNVMEQLKMLNYFESHSECYDKFLKLFAQVKEALTRLFIIKRLKKNSQDVMRYLLAPPETLFYISLKKSNFPIAEKILNVSFFMLYVLNTLFF